MNMVTSLKTEFAQIISRCPKNLSCPKSGGAAAPLAPPARTPMGERRAKEQALLEALERPDISQLQVREFLELADEHGQARPAPSKQSDKPFFIPVPFLTGIFLVQLVVVLLFLFCFSSIFVLFFIHCFLE